MMLSKPLQITFLYSIDTLAQVIDENPVKHLNFFFLHAICGPSAAQSSPRDGRDWLKKSLLIRDLDTHKLTLVF